MSNDVAPICSDYRSSASVGEKVLTFHGFCAIYLGFFMAVAQEVLLTALLEKVHVVHG